MSAIFLCHLFFVLSLLQMISVGKLSLESTQRGGRFTYEQTSIFNLRCKPQGSETFKFAD